MEETNTETSDGGDIPSSYSSGASSSEGRGSWKHAALHVATTIATPAAYAPLPFAVASLGWNLGVISLVGATFTTWYSSLLIASLWKWNGEKHTTYRKLAESIFGPWGYWSITIFQQVASLGNNIAIHIIAGSCLKAVYKYFCKDGSLTLQIFIVAFGALELLLSQLPDIHSLRWVNAVCTLSTIGFAGTTIGVTIYNGKVHHYLQMFLSNPVHIVASNYAHEGKQVKRETLSYSMQGSSTTKAFRAFNALGTIAFSFGDAMLPEIQSTIREPSKWNMYKGVSAAYTVIMLTYWQIAFVGFWAFGSQVQPFILASLTNPQWTIATANIFAVVQITGCFQIYCRPTYIYLEERLLPRYSIHGHRVWNRVATRFALSTVYMFFITLVAAAMPFFGDFVSICGAVGFTPLDFVFPALAFSKARRLPKEKGFSIFLRTLNLAIATLFSIVAVLGCIGAVRFIVEDIRTYKFFYNM